MPEPGEIHQGEAAVVASIVENGPRSAVEVSRDLWPDGMTVSRRTGQPAPKRNPLGDARRKLNALAERQILEVRGDRWHLGHAAGSVWAVYFATNRIFAGVYDANVNLVSHADWRPGRGVEHHDNLDALLSLGSAHWLRPCGVRPRGGRPRARWAWVSPPPSSRTVAA